MNKIVLILAALALASCSLLGEDPHPTNSVYVVNSAWELVRVESVYSSRGIYYGSLEASVIEYNETHPDDQQTILDAPPDIADSPTVDAYIVNAATHEIIDEYIDWPRADLTERRDQWRAQTASYGAAVLYVDHIPPAPEIIIDTRSDFEKYALYLVAADGSILFEEHCADSDIGDYASVQAYYDRRLRTFELQARSDGGGEYVVAGSLYPPPPPPPPEEPPAE